MKHMGRQETYIRQQLAYQVQGSFYWEKKIDCNSRQYLNSSLLASEDFNFLYLYNPSNLCPKLVILLYVTSGLNAQKHYFQLSPCKSGTNLLDLHSVL